MTLSRRDLLVGSACIAPSLAVAEQRLSVPGIMAEMGGRLQGAKIVASGDESWPDASNTGTSGTLTPHSGDFTTTSDDQVIENLNVTGVIWVNHGGVTVRNCRAYVIFAGADPHTAPNCIVEDCTVIGSGEIQITGIIINHNSDGCVVRRCNISGCENGMLPVANDLLVEDNWIHDLNSHGYPDPHQDGMQVAGATNLTIRHNNIALGGTSTNACIFCKDGINDNIDIINNRIDGGSYTIYFETGTSNCTVDGNTFVSFTYGWIAGATMEQQTYTNNTFKGVFYATGHPNSRRRAR
jgi:hypothetical protein